MDDYEAKVLEYEAGYRTDVRAGAASNQAIEFLVTSGYLEELWHGNFPPKRWYKVTQKGWDFLKERHGR